MRFFRRSQPPEPSKERFSIFHRLRSKINLSNNGDSTAESVSTPLSSVVSREVGDGRRTVPRNKSDKHVTHEATPAAARNEQNKHVTHEEIGARNKSDKDITLEETATRNEPNKDITSEETAAHNEPNNAITLEETTARNEPDKEVALEETAARNESDKDVTYEETITHNESDKDVTLDETTTHKESDKEITLEETASRNNESEKDVTHDETIAGNESGKDVTDEEIAARNELDTDVTYEETTETELSAVNSDSASEQSISIAPSTRPSSPQYDQELGLWSAAYREAVESQDAVDPDILKVEKIQDLLVQLETTESGSPDDSLFRKGLKHLEEIKGPLKQMKLVLDVTSPLASIEPAAATVIGIVQGVTAHQRWYRLYVVGSVGSSVNGSADGSVDGLGELAISLATARETLTVNIGEMLEQIQVIDECDTVGQQMDHRREIHLALVEVYSTMLEFYSVAYELLHIHTGKLTLEFVQDDTKLPDLISRFIELTRRLKECIDLARSELVEDIHTNIISNNVKQWLGFDKILSRDRFHTSAEEVRSDVACEWLLKDKTFRKWYSDPGSAQLVLTGEMGCGKTVLATYVTKRILLRSDHQVPRSLVCYHYCRDDESGNGLYIAQSLVLQLLQQHAKPLEKNFHDWYKAICAQNKPAPATDIDALLGYFFDRVGEIGMDREVIVILDGLDECDTKIAKFVDGFQILCNEVPHFKVLYSTRPHTMILDILSHVPQLSISSKLNRNRDETLASHFVRKLEPKLGQGEGKRLMNLLVAHLAQFAQGSAIWIKVMVDLVNDQHIVDSNDMKEFLQNTPHPQELNDVYVELFRHRVKGNPKLIAIASRALEILAVSCRPLSIRELAYAVALTGCKDPPTRLHDIEAVLAPNRIKQLIEPFVIQYDPKEETLPQIKLLHRSLQEFIFRCPPLEWTNALLSTSLHYEVPEATEKRRLAMERQLFRACTTSLTFVRFEEMSYHSLPNANDLFDDEIIGLLDEPNEIARLDPMGPFFDYAGRYWFDHYARAVDPSQEVLEQVIHPAEPSLARQRNWANFRTFDFFRAVINSWCRADRTQTRPWDDVFDLVRYAFGDMVRDSWANELLCESARCGCIGIVQRLFEEEDAALRSQLLVDDKRDYQYKNTSQYWQIHQSVGEAVLGNSVEVVRYLLDQPGIGPHFRHRNHRDYTVFHLVACICNPEIMELLLSRLSSLCGDDEAELLINQANSAHDTALNMIISGPRERCGRLQCIELLLKSGADPNAPRNQIECRPLTRAAIQGDLDLIRLLVKYGGDAVDPGTILVPVEDEEEADAYGLASSPSSSRENVEINEAVGSGGGKKKMALKYPMVDRHELLPDVVDLLTELLADRQERLKTKDVSAARAS